MKDSFSELNEIKGGVRILKRIQGPGLIYREISCEWQ